MKLDLDEIMVAVPAGAELHRDCREALEIYATRPLRRRADVGIVYVIAGSRVAEIERLARLHKVPLQTLPAEALWE